jgi:hypothetical protein
VKQKAENKEDPRDQHGLVDGLDKSLNKYEETNQGQGKSSSYVRIV